MSEPTPSTDQIGTVDFTAQAAQWIQATSRVHFNLGQEILVTTEDKVWRILANYLAEVENRNAWTTPLGILIAILMIFPTTSFQSFIVSAATWEAIFIVSGVLSFFWFVRSLWQSKGSRSVVGFFKSLLRSQDTTIDDLVTEIKRTAIASDTAGQVIATQESQVIFYDRFDSLDDWQQYKDGRVSQSQEIIPHSGAFCLKKEGANDPSGGFKKSRRRIALGLVFSGWIYSPKSRAGGKVSRLALENSDFDGYGFAVDHGNNNAWIERRENGVPTPIGSKVSLKLPTDEWYRFELYLGVGRQLRLKLYDHAEKELLDIADVSDDKLDSFDRVAVHGGSPYYVDELKITLDQT